jgi:hypothetical protein
MRDNKAASLKNKPRGRKMKYLVHSPIEAAARTGGCTFEPGVGWWTFSSSPAPELGDVIEGTRDALYIPTLEKSGAPVASDKIEGIKARAQGLGFNRLACARGMWVLSETGEAQVEVIWIAWCDQVAETIRGLLPSLAREIRELTNQDCVAWEEGGELRFAAA